jgi:hypothetical protein
MEYQDYEYQNFKNFEKKIEQAHEKLESAQTTLTEAEFPNYKEIFEADNFGNNYILYVEHGSEDWEARQKRILV